jgi:CHC2 zinc finger
MPGAKRRYIDYGAVKNAVSVVDALRHYDALESFQPSEDGNSLLGSCPICKTTNNKPFRISEGSKGWYCLAKCRRGGNVLDLVASMEDTSLHEAATLLNDWFTLELLPQAHSKKVVVQKRTQEDTSKATTDGKGFLRGVDKELRELLVAGDDDETIRYVKAIVLESYRNGIALATKDAEEDD